MEEYYIQNKSQGYVGNSMLWWKVNNCGYVCDIRDAKTFNAVEADKVIKNAMKDKYVIWDKKYIDSKIQYHIDIQSVDIRDKNSH